MPLVKRGTCAGHGKVDILCATGRNLADHVTRCGVDRRHFRATPRLKLPVDKRRTGRIQLGGNRFVFGM